MDATQAIKTVEAWMRTSPDGDRTVGEDALTVQRDHVTEVGGGWHVPFNAASYLNGTDMDKGIIPTPVMFVPNDGSQLRYATDMSDAAEPSHGNHRRAEADATEWVEIVDSEFDRDSFPSMKVPQRAILGWQQIDEQGNSTGAHKVNPRCTVGPVWRGFPRPRSPADALLNYFNANWIDKSTFIKHLLDCDVLLPLNEHGAPHIRQYGDTYNYQVFSSSTQIIAGHTRWRRVRPRLLLEADAAAGLVLNPGRVLKQTFKHAELRGMLSIVNADASAPSGNGKTDYATDDYVVEYSAEASSEIAATVISIAAEFDLASTEILDQQLAQVAQLSRANGYELTLAELQRYARGFAWIVHNGSRFHAGGSQQSWPEALPANGLVAHYDSAGKVAPKPWTYGKFFSKATPDGNLGWHRIVGAYVGFAIGDAIGSLIAHRKPGDKSPITALQPGPLTRKLLLHTETVIRGLPWGNEGGAIPEAFPPPFDANGWLAEVTSRLASHNADSNESSELMVGLAATLAGGASSGGINERYLTTVAAQMLQNTANPELDAGVEALVRLFWRLLSHEEFAYPVHIRLSELTKTLEPDSVVHGLFSEVLALREDRAAEDTAQAETIGDGYSPLSVLGRALFASAKRGYDPERAIRVAVNQSGNKPLTGALTGAIVGARAGVPGIPALWVGALPELGLVENIASDAFWHFNSFGVSKEPSAHAAWQLRYPPA